LEFTGGKAVALDDDKPPPALLGGKLIELQPAQVDFCCPGCGLSCRLFPRHMPMAVQHQVPNCKQYEEAIREDDIAGFLRAAGLPIG
jgi:hypothetical protein